MPAGITDFHCHVLPGMDDGSPDETVTAAMLELLASQGVSRLCATSHFYRWDEDETSFLRRREAALHRAAPLAGSIELIPGAEVAYFPGITESSELPALCVAGTNTLLLEMPFAIWTGDVQREVLRLSLDQGYRLVMAHPERYLGIKQNVEFLSQLARMGAAFQVNADTLLSWRMRRKGLALLEQTELPLLGSDSHNVTYRPPRLEQARQVIAKKLGQPFLRAMDENAEELCTDYRTDEYYE